MAKLKVTSFNCRGIMSNYSYVDKLINETDILCLQEHLLCDDNVEFIHTMGNQHKCCATCDSYVNDHGYVIKRGGVPIIWRIGLDHVVTKLDTEANNRVIGVKISVPNTQPLYLLNVYMPSGNYSCDEYVECLDEVINMYVYYAQCGNVLVVGDMNVSIMNGNRSLLNTSHDLRRVEMMQKFLDEHDLMSVVTDDKCTGPLETYFYNDGNAGTQIDHILIPISMYNCVSSCHVIDDEPLNCSDHYPVSIELLCNIPKAQLRTRTIYRWDKADLESYTTQLEYALERSMLVNDTIGTVNEMNSYCDSLLNIMAHVTNKTIPKSKFCKYKKPYWTPELTVLHNEQKRLRAKWIAAGRPRGRQHPSYAAYKDSKKTFSAILDTELHKYEQKQYYDAEIYSDMDIRKFWKYVNGKKDRKQSFHVLNHDNQTYTTPDEQRGLWKCHFEKLLNEQSAENSLYNAAFKETVDTKVDYLTRDMSSETDPMGIPLHDFTTDEITNVCTKLPLNKSPDVNLITYENFKYSGKVAKQCIAYLFNAILRCVAIPDAFKRGVIIILHKGGNKPKDKLNSYRGITLLPTLNKVFEKCISRRMDHFITSHNFPPQLQYASKQKHSTVSLSYAIQETILDKTEHGGKVFACFLDIAQAFDRIWINGLLVKLFQIGITNKLWFLVKDWFASNVCTILFNGVLSEPFKISRSIKQGGILSMLFFAVSFYDVHDFVKQNNSSSPVLGLECGSVYIGSPAYADDLALMCDTVNGLNEMLCRAYHYSKQWRIQFSPTKSKCMVFGERKRQNCKNLNKREFYLGNDRLEEVTHFKHLGIELCSYNCTKKRTTDLCTKGTRVLAGLTAIGVHETGLIPQISVSLWNKICIPAMLYGSELWHDLPNYQITMIEKTQIKVLKRVQGLPLRTHDIIVRRLVGQKSILSLGDQRKMYFLQRLISTNVNTLHKRIFIKRLYDWLYGLYQNGYVPDIYATLAKYHLLDYFMRYITGGKFPDKIIWKALVKEAVLKYELENNELCLKEINDVPRYLRIHKKGFYLMYKVLKLIPDQTQSRSDIRALSKLITLPLLSEYKTCELCGIEFNDIVEHAFMRCMWFNEIRSEMWDKILDQFGVEMAVYLFQCPEEQCLDIFLGRTYIKGKDKLRDFYTIIAYYCRILTHCIHVNLIWFK
jgi:exonuclease III